MRLGNFEGEEVFCPFNSLVPMVNPNDIVIGGWDISGVNMAEAMHRAQVIDFELQRQLVPYMKEMPTPLPGNIVHPTNKSMVGYCDGAPCMFFIVWLLQCLQS